MQDKIFSILTNKDSVSWKTLIFGVIQESKMDPWDVNVSLLTKQYLKMIKRMQGFDFLIGGKVLLAAAFLVRLKSTKLVNEDLMEFDRLIADTQKSEEEFLGEFYDDLESDLASGYADNPAPEPEQPLLVPRTPQPRKRKVSVYDLVNALQKALEVHERKVFREMESPTMTAPEKKRDITEIIMDIYERIRSFFSKGSGKKLTFRNLIPSENKEDIIQTFVPLLHLSHASKRKINLIQKKHFGEIRIELLKDA